jgi:hypothetical protein
MAYDCKVYDKNGILKREITSEEIKKAADISLIDQKSTKLAQKRIASFTEGKVDTKTSSKFYTNKCIQCGHVFHPRQCATKYCSHECQKKFYYEKKIKKTK